MVTPDPSAPLAAQPQAPLDLEPLKADVRETIRLGAKSKAWTQHIPALITEIERLRLREAQAAPQQEPALAPSGYTTAWELLQHVQAKHHQVSIDGEIHCSCGAVFTYARPAVTVAAAPRSLTPEIWWIGMNGQGQIVGGWRTEAEALANTAYVTGVKPDVLRSLTPPAPTIPDYCKDCRNCQLKRQLEASEAEIIAHEAKRLTPPAPHAYTYVQHLGEPCTLCRLVMEHSSHVGSPVLGHDRG